MQWFSWRTCTVRASCPALRTPGGEGGVRGHAPPKKFVKLDSLKCNFPRSLDRNWVTGIMTGIISFFFDCMHYITKWVKSLIKESSLSLVNKWKKKTNDFHSWKNNYFVWTTGRYMSNNRTLRRASGLKRNPCGYGCERIALCTRLSAFTPWEHWLS